MAKAGLASLAEGRTDLFRMNPSKIEIREGWNSRDFDHPDNVAHVEALAASIREVGIKEPLAGYMEGEVFILTNGESRLRAVRKLLAEGVEIIEPSEADLETFNDGAEAVWNNWKEEVGEDVGNRAIALALGEA
jgi:hypothetical protein